VQRFGVGKHEPSFGHCAPRMHPVARGKRKCYGSLIKLRILMLYTFPILLVLLCFAVWPAHAVSSTGPAAVEPVVRLKDGNIRACGLRATFSGGSAAPIFELIMRRRGSDTFLELRAVCGTEPDRPSRPVLKTRTVSTGDLLKGEAYQVKDFVVLSAPATSDKVAMLIQELMIGGGSFSCFESFGKQHALSGPLPNQTRAAYLNCAGDLFRPEEQQ
jgi:hypothetical protein